ncbi:hypothetical protein HH212_00110 [Massilia forsythiae]|uniref:Uncharacterized protein n=1 Tax=Massilia forsythiae TaxID=2728020 RepID=A0A7Z2VT07_9BURK|nr:hypothetical protein [Massilia forsythiae]QJD98640.1 hypothetical protein HH212_00110 [Massilia forsythiae]
MAQNETITLSAYLEMRGKKAKALTRGEADLLHIPFPLKNGWPRKYGPMLLTDEMVERLVATKVAAEKEAEKRARRIQAQAERRAAAAQGQLSMIEEPAPSQALVRTGPRFVQGFRLRPAQRQLQRPVRKSAPWS